MTALVLARASMRSHSATLANWLAVSLAIVIPLSNSLTTVISLLLAVTCILQMDRVTWYVVLKHPVTIAILILVALSILDVSYSIANQKEITLALRKIVRLLYFPLLLPIFMRPEWRQRACIGFLSAIFLSVIAAIFHEGVVFKDTIFTSLFVAFAVYMLAHFIIEYKEYRMLTIPMAFFLTLYLFFIGYGRTGQLLFIMLLVLFAWQRLKLSFKQYVLVSLLLAVTIAAMLMVPSSFAMRQTVAVDELKQYMQNDEATIPHSSSMGTRLVLAHNAWELIKLKPIFGWGTGSFAAAYKKYAPESQVKDVVRVNPHNQYLLTWVELGLPGLVTLLLMFTSAAWLFFRSKSLEGYLGLGLICAIMGGCTMNSWLLDFTSSFFFVFFAAVFAGAALVLPRQR